MCQHGSQVAADLTGSKTCSWLLKQCFSEAGLMPPNQEMKIKP